MKAGELGGTAARQWLADREAEPRPLPCYHMVFTLPSAIGAIAWQNEAEAYGLRKRCSAPIYHAFSRGDIMGPNEQRSFQL